MPQLISRRHFLALAGIGGGAALVGCRSGGGPATSVEGGAAATRVGVAQRALVVIELSGGNDGLAMAPPLESSRLHALRPTIAHDDADLLHLGAGLGLHPALARLHERGVGVVHGIGSRAPDLSHFEMLRRWWTGDPDGTNGLPTGFLGRLCDALDEGAPVTGVSIGGASTPALLSESAGTIGLPDPGWLWWLNETDDDALRAFQDGLAAMAATDRADGAALALARSGIAGGLRVGDLVADIPTTTGYPASDVGAKLALASHLLTADVGVRVVHLTMGGDFDTHEGQRERHDSLMAELDEGVDTFLADLEAQSWGDRVLVATTSEFGRRPEENDSAGVDHGTASVALLAGAVRGVRVGEPPSLDDLDGDGNLVATAGLDRYYATLAEWFEVPPARVLPGDPEAFSLL
jgi:uncharacterized protein (DUF1501 family)